MHGPRRRNGKAKRNPPTLTTLWRREVPFAAGVSATRRARTATAGYPPPHRLPPVWRAEEIPGGQSQRGKARSRSTFLTRARVPPPTRTPHAPRHRQRVPASATGCRRTPRSHLSTSHHRPWRCRRRNLYIPELPHSPACSLPPPLFFEGTTTHTHTREPRTEPPFEVLDCSIVNTSVVFY